MKKKKVEPIILDVGRMKLSFSAVDMYLRCGQQYKFRYIDGIKEIPAVALIEGSAHHKALEQNNLSKRDKGRDMNHHLVTDIFMDEFAKRIKAEGQVDWAEENENKIFTRAKSWHENYINDIAPGIRPVEVERRFELPVDIPNGRESKPTPVLLVGVCDFEQKDDLFDYKTASRSKGQGEVDNSLQLSLYAYASKKRKVGIIEFLKTANPHVGVLTSSRTPQQIMWSLQVVRSVALAIQSGSFPLAPPNSWQCSERFCGFWNRCRGKYS